jgi:hypothetical protein
MTARSRLALSGLLVAAVAVVLFLRQPGQDAVARQPRGTLAPGGARPPSRAARAPVMPDRNVFEYGPSAGRSPARTVAPPAIPAPDTGGATPAETTPRAPEPVRLVGLVNRGGKLAAALSILGEVMVLGPGEEAEGYRVLSVDSDQGVRLRGPDGTERALTTAENR